MWNEQARPVVVGELTTDGKRIVLMSTGGPVWAKRFALWLKEATPLIKPSDPPGALVLPTSWPAAVQLGHILGRAWQPGPRLTEWVTAELARRGAAGAGGLAVTPPEGCEPRPYQVAGARMVAATGRGLLFDDQGTGKTITTILGLVEREHDNPGTALPVLCVVPNSVVDSWVDAWRTWAPAWRVTAWRGVRATRRQLAGSAEVYVVSYDIARMDGGAIEDPLVRLGARSVVIDECHLIKSPQAMRSLAARRLARRAQTFVALSGTPITHHPGDLWPTLEALAPKAYPSRERYDTRYLHKVSGDYGEQVVGLRPDTEPEFRASLLGQHRRVTKAEVLAQLPPKIHSVRTVELPKEWRKIYDDMERQMLAELPDGQELSVMSVLAQLTRLSQLASAAADIQVTQDEDEREHVNVRLKTPSWKVDELIAVLEERPGQPVVTFAPSKQLMVIAGAAAEHAGLHAGYVMGGQTSAERTETVEAFQRGKLDLLCATTGAGGVGLTLTAAGTVVFLQRPWSIVEAIQAEDRCHRIGSEHHDSIEIIDVVAANTVDTRVRSVLREKAGQLSDLLQDPGIVRDLLGGEDTKRRKKGKS